MKENTIWLRKLIILMLNTETSALSVSFRYLSRLLSFKRAAILLREIYRDPEDQDIKLICVENSRAYMYPVPKGDQEKLEDTVKRVLKAGKPIPAVPGIAVPMRCTAAKDFGVLFLETESTDWDSRKQEAVESFSELVYGDAMGGFLKSIHPTAVQVRDITARYDLKNPKAPSVVDHCTFDINRGELTVIMGHSGGGKTTLLNIIGGLLRPVSGEVLWEGKDICRMKRRELDSYHRDVLGFIFQNYNLIPDLTAKENVSVASALCPGPGDPVEILKVLGLGHRLDARPGQMSGGEQQRVCIARALVKDPGILLCDEPTGALDTDSTKTIMSILQKVAKGRNIPVVVVTHNPEFVVLADHYVFMKDGHIEKDDYQPFPFPAGEVL